MRPSTDKEKEAKRVLAKLERGEDERLVVKVSQRTRWGVKAAASARRMTVKAFLLSLAKGAGADIDPADLGAEE
jgi:uncharacterized protein (DUF1778 family)